jgi:hypothetical protein
LSAEGSQENNSNGLKPGGISRRSSGCYRDKRDGVLLDESSAGSFATFATVLFIFGVTPQAKSTDICGDFVRRSFGCGLAAPGPRKIWRFEKLAAIEQARG